MIIRRPEKLSTYIMDAAMLTLALGICFFMIQRPGPVKMSAADKARAAQRVLAVDNASDNTATPLNTGYSDTSIKHRNIFAPDGKYYTSRDVKTLPEDPYSLVAVFLGKEKTAVFRDYKGATFHLKLRDKLMDDAVITRIERESVEVRKGSKARIYGIELGRPRPGELKKMPENPYNLIAVVQGKEKRAVFKEFTGSVISLSTGQKLIDGAVISSIGDESVTVKKGGKTKEYRILHVGR